MTTLVGSSTVVVTRAPVLAPQDDEDDAMPAWPEEEAAMLVGEGGDMGGLPLQRWVVPRMNGAHNLARTGAAPAAAVEVCVPLPVCATL